jgi:hypothetical protein
VNDTRFDVFRFVNQRPVSRVTPGKPPAIFVEAYGRGEYEGELHQRVRQGLRDSDRTTVTAIEQFIDDTDLFRGAVADIDPPIPELDRFLATRRDRAKGKPVLDQLKDHKRLSRLVTNPEYLLERSRVSDSLLAVVLSARFLAFQRAELLRAITLYGFLEWLVRLKEKAEDLSADEVEATITSMLVILPGDVFPETSFGSVPADEQRLNPYEDRYQRSLTSDDADRELPEGHVGESPVEEQLRNQLRDTQDAIEGLWRASREEATTRRSEAEEPQPNESEPSTTIATLNADPFLVTESVLRRLDHNTKRVVTSVVGADEEITVPMVVERLQAELARAAEAVPDGGAHMVMSGSAVPLTSLSGRSSHAGRDGRPLGFRRPVLARAPAIGDLLVVRQQLVAYEAGEVAHIENVLIGERRRRAHRFFDLIEQTTTTERETEEEREKDLQTTERFELQQESSQTIQNDSQMQAGATVTASYGPTVSVTGNVGYATNSSRAEATRTASDYAKDVTQRSAERIRERVLERRVVTTKRTITEDNEHRFDNTDGEEHIRGVYRWVDKVYDSQMYNYGARLLLEVAVPEPAAFHIYALASRQPPGVTLAQPPVPVNPFTNQPLKPSDINEATYPVLVAIHQPSGVRPPPPEYVIAAGVFEKGVKENFQSNAPGSAEFGFKATKEVAVPKGYAAVGGTATVLSPVWTNPPSSGSGGGGNSNMVVRQGGWLGPTNARAVIAVAGSHVTLPKHRDAYYTPFTLQSELSGEVPVAFMIEDTPGFAVAIRLACKRTPATFATWQLETYELIMRAYYAQKADYDARLAAAIGQDPTARGRNPRENADTIRTELKRWAIEAVTQPAWSRFDAMNPGDPSTQQLPSVDWLDAYSEGEAVQFVEQSIEWEQMTYLFYPYFWGRQERWPTASLLTDPDPLYAAFLRAGYARVVLPVRRGFESTVCFFLATGRLWSGGPAPWVNHPLYIPLAAELRAAQALPDGGIQEGAPWELRLPTTLVWLQDDAQLPRTTP